VDPFPTIYDKSVHLGHSIITGHPFHDGNKRTGMYITLFTLNVNDYLTSVRTVTNQEVKDMSLEIESDKISKEYFASWLKEKVVSEP